MKPKYAEKPKFDYHLESSEQQSAEKLVPLHQAKIHLAMRCDFKINGTKYERGAVCLSEHMLVFGKKRMIGKSFNLVTMIHLLDLKDLETHSDYMFTFQTSEVEGLVYSKESMRLARNILRDYILCNTMTPIDKRFKFKTHDSNQFPPFNPTLSPSQCFQFTYNAYCSYYDTTYYHQVVNCFHKNLTAGTGIIDFNQFPLMLTECNLRNPMDLRPFFESLQYCPYVFGVACTDITRPDFLKAMVPIIQNNKSLHIVSLENCMIETGVAEFAYAIQQNPDIQVCYWDFSGNKFDDAVPLMAAFTTYPTEVFFLDFGDCDLSKEATDILFHAIHSNEKFWKLEYLHIKGAKITTDAAKTFKSHMKNMVERGMHHLQSIDFGKITSGVEIILDAIVKGRQPIESIRIANTKLSEECVSSLLSIISGSEKLRELDISGTGLNYDQIHRIIKAIGNNSNLKNFALWLGGLKINGEMLKKVLTACIGFPKKWGMLSFESNKLDAKDVRAITKSLSKLTSLRGIRLGDNFHHSQRGIGEALAELAGGRQLFSLSAQGLKSNGLESQILPLLEAVKQNTTLTSLDVRNNYFGDEGLKALADAVRCNTSLRQLKYDGSRPREVDAVIELMDAIKDSDTMISCKLPNDDVYKAIARHRSKERAVLESEISDAQGRVYVKLMQNQVRADIRSFLALKNIRHLNMLVDELGAQLLENLGSTPLHTHSGIGEILGVRLPFQTGDEEGEAVGSVSTVAVEGAREYDTEGEGQKVITEHLDDDLSALSTLQFNSLAIRRPSSGRRGIGQAFGGSDTDSSDGGVPMPQPSRFGDLGNLQPPEPVKPQKSKLAPAESSSSYSSYSYSSSYYDSDSSSAPKRSKGKGKKSNLRGVSLPPPSNF